MFTTMPMRGALSFIVIHLVVLDSATPGFLVLHHLPEFALQGTVKSLLQHHSSKASILWCSAVFMVQLSLFWCIFVFLTHSPHALTDISLHPAGKRHVPVTQASPGSSLKIQPLVPHPRLTGVQMWF